MSTSDILIRYIQCATRLSFVICLVVYIDRNMTI